MVMLIDKDKALELLNRAVAEKPDGYADENVVRGHACEYANEDGTPSCLVGTALSYTGFDLGNLTYPGEIDLFVEIPEDVTGEFIGNKGVLGNDPNYEMTLDALVLFRTAQEEQDGGSTWADAVQVAIETEKRHTTWTTTNGR